MIEKMKDNTMRAGSVTTLTQGIVVRIRNIPMEMMMVLTASLASEMHCSRAVVSSVPTSAEQVLKMEVLSLMVSQTVPSETKATLAAKKWILWSIGKQKIQLQMEIFSFRTPFRCIFASKRVRFDDERSLLMTRKIASEGLQLRCVQFLL